MPRFIAVVEAIAFMSRGCSIDEIERLLAEAENDANDVSSTAIRLSNKFGSSQLLSDFIAEANRIRDKSRRQRLQFRQIMQEPASAERNVRLQLLLTETSQTRIEVTQLKSLMEEISRND